MERKAEVKREILPDYLPWVEGALSGGKGQPDEVLVTVMLWRIDAGDYGGALDIAEYVLAHGLPLPDRFNRTTATIAEEIADAAKRARVGGESFACQVLTYTAELTDGHDMPDQCAPSCTRKAVWPSRPPTRPRRWNIYAAPAAGRQRRRQKRHRARHPHPEKHCPAARWRRGITEPRATDGRGGRQALRRQPKPLHRHPAQDTP
ncbi:phage terminase small subunit [Chromobacterium sphagni]|uniref:phage terminase small subunit n=1 Tax=Chromobacterium sphagni TaxID=1903179 RepID=UPI000AC8D74A|nr:phage terminase small subunit [Chromobacterium sphagni]